MPVFFSRIFAAARLLLVWLMQRQGGVQALYDLLGVGIALGPRKMYANLGYWRDNPENLDEAGDALADLLAEQAQLTEADLVLDVGCGFGDQDARWLETKKPRGIVAMNISYQQLNIAAQRDLFAGKNALVFANGDATKLPFLDATFDCILALESAFHFDTRETFFQEASRVLKPGGRLVLADLSVHSRALSLGQRCLLYSARMCWKIPATNLVTSSTYLNQLEQSGFCHIHLRSIWQDVHPAFCAWGYKELNNLSEERRRRINPLYLAMLRFRLRQGVKDRENNSPMDYIVVSARKSKEPLKT